MGYSLVLLLLLALSSLAVAEYSAESSEEAAEGSEEWSAEGPVVRVQQGLLRGVRIHRGPKSTLRTLYAFMGVPYALPPVGPLRFQDPVEAEPWTGIRNATAYGPICVQDNATVSVSEDCLFLNVFTADPPAIWRNVRRPVVVAIPGGGFYSGSGEMDKWRPDPLLAQQIVLVSMNYRLGVLGFLNTEDTQAPGNAGLKDQVLALRWVQTNIAAFGGDPSKVAIMGHSAGGASVQYHILSPLSRGFFRSAISFSGSVLPTWAHVQQPRRYAEGLHRMFAADCPDDAPGAIVRCLQRVDARELVARQYDVPVEPFQNYIQKTTFLPAVEAAGSSHAPFLTAEPEQLMREGRFADVPYMTGYTSADSTVFISYGGPLVDPSRWAEVDKHFADIFSWDMPPGLRTPEMALRMRKFYLGDRSLTDASRDIDTVDRFFQMMTDLYFVMDSVNTASLMADSGATVYVYNFSRDGPIAFRKDLLINASYIPGVAHGDEKAYFYDFTMPGEADPMPIPASEVPLRERIIEIVCNMIKLGNPTPAGSGLPHWPPFREPAECYMDMGLHLRVRSSPDSARISFWRQLAADAPQTTPAVPTAPPPSRDPSTQ